jgi:site-specific recombinase XerD
MDFLSNCIQINTQRNYHSAIKKFYAICLHQKDKFKHIPYAKQSRKLPIPLSVEEVQKMFSVCENLKHKVITHLSIWIDIFYYLCNKKQYGSL